MTLASWPVPEWHKGGWQPIETAPRDGSSILVWMPPYKGRPGSERDFSFVEWSELLNKWQLTESGSHAADADPTNDKPTHWMPLPAPPHLEPGEVFWWER